MNILLVFILMFLASCEYSEGETKTKNALNIQEVKKGYNSYLEDGFERIPVDVLAVRKSYTDHILQVEFYDSPDVVSIKTWLFPIDSFVENKQKYIDKVLYEKDLIRASLIHESHYEFCALSTLENVLLSGSIVSEDNKDYIQLTYYNPKK